MISPVEVQCDFCDSNDVVWRYRATSFILDTTIFIRGNEMNFPWGSEGDWAACETCSSLIEADDYDAIVERSVATNPLVPLLAPEDIPGLKLAVRRLMDTFREKRVGQRSKNWS